MDNDIFEDATLINALMAIVDIYHIDVTRKYILSGLPVDPKRPKLYDQNPKNAHSLFTRAAEKAGFKSRLEKKALKSISPEILPCILLLGEDRACVLLEFDSEKEYAHILIPGKFEQDGWVHINDLQQEYTGSLFLLGARQLNEV